MDLQDLKSSWQNAGGPAKMESDLQKMTRISRLPSIKKIRIKLIMETIGLTLFLLVYRDWFDGDKKPFFVNALLVSSVLLYIFNDVLGYISLVLPASGANLKLSLQQYLVRIRRLSVFSLMVSSLYSIFLILFFSAVINFTKVKVLLLVGVLILMALMVWFSFRTWNKWIRALASQVEDFTS
ncbi:hypothetical protein ACX0G9_31360 [Flavitalea flava]